MLYNLEEKSQPALLLHWPWPRPVIYSLQILTFLRSIVASTHTYCAFLTRPCKGQRIFNKQGRYSSRPQLAAAGSLLTMMNPRVINSEISAKECSIISVNHGLLSPLICLGSWAAFPSLCVWNSFPLFSVADLHSPAWLEYLNWPDTGDRSWNRPVLSYFWMHARYCFTDHVDLMSIILRSKILSLF